MPATSTAAVKMIVALPAAIKDTSVISVHFESQNDTDSMLIFVVLLLLLLMLLLLLHYLYRDRLT